MDESAETTEGHLQTRMGSKAGYEAVLQEVSPSPGWVPSPIPARPRQAAARPRATARRGATCCAAAVAAALRVVLPYHRRTPSHRGASQRR